MLVIGGRHRSRDQQAQEGCGSLGRSPRARGIPLLGILLTTAGTAARVP